MSKEKLSDGQLNIIKLLYRYRFGSIDLLRTSLKMKNNSGLYQKLEVLIKHGYVGKHYKKEYRLIGFPAAYHLLPKAYKELSSRYGYDVPEAMVKAGYRDNVRSKAFVAHFLQVYEASIELTRLYPGSKFFTGRDLIGYESFPNRLPDGYLSLPTNGGTRRYFLDVIPESTPRYVINKMVSDYNDFFLEGGWNETGSDLPALLILAETGKSERYLQKLLRNRQDSLDMTEPHFYTSNISALKGSAKDNSDIWSEIYDPEDLLDLESL